MLKAIIEILNTWGAIGGVVVALGWFVKQVVDQTLKARHEVKMKRIEFVTGKQIEIMQSVNSKIYEVQAALANYVSLVGAIRADKRKTDGDTFAEKLKELEDTFEPNRIYFPDELAEEISQLIDKINTTAVQFLTRVHHAPTTTDTGKWLEVGEFTKTECPRIRREIEIEIRKHMY